MKPYPKILIINSYGFNDYKGGGITLKNLFFGWPIDKIALAHWDFSEPMESICTNYYRFGYDDHHYIFPLNIISNEPRFGINGPYIAEAKEHSRPGPQAGPTEQSPKSSNFLKRLFLLGINKTGAEEVVRPLRLSKTFKKWVLEFGPDIIYSQFGNMAFTDIVLKVHKITKSKVVVHIMDDWPSTIYKNKLLGFALRSMVLGKFVKVLKLSSLRLGISEAMASEYEKRYHVPFDYFHNPVRCSDFNTPPPVIKKDNHFIIVYAGRIGIASHDSIIEFAQCVQELRREGFNLTFHVYTDMQNNDFDTDKFNYEGTLLLPALNDKDYVTKMSEADLLLYPVDFSAESIQYIRLSFPTKLPSYLSSGVPVFSYGPENVYSIRYMIDKELGFVCTKQELPVLKEKLISSLSDLNLRSKFAEAARKYAYDHFDTVRVRELFHAELRGTLDKV